MTLSKYTYLSIIQYLYLNVQQNIYCFQTSNSACQLRSHPLIPLNCRHYVAYLRVGRRKFFWTLLSFLERMKLVEYRDQFERRPLSFHMDLKFIILKVLTFTYPVSQTIMHSNVLYSGKERNWKSSKQLSVSFNLGNFVFSYFDHLLFVYFFFESTYFARKFNVKKIMKPK